MAEFISVEPERMAAELSERGLAWADAQAAAEALEESRKSVLAEMTLSQDGKSLTEREAKALACTSYREHVEKMVAARRGANRARVRFDVYKVFVELTRSKVATERAAMNLR